MLRLLLIGFVVVLIFGVLDELGFISEERPAEPAGIQMKSCTPGHRTDNSGRPYTLGPRCQIIYADPKLNEIQTRLCLSGRIHSSRCGF